MNSEPHTLPRRFIPIPFAYHEEIELTIQTLTNEGCGMGRVNNWVVMVPFVIPGETVRIRIFRNHKQYSEADLIEILKASPQRVTPKCPLFGQCGGCQYQHMIYSEQLRWKQKQVKDCLERIGKISFDVQPLIFSQKTYFYRTKLTPHFERSGNQCLIGFLANGSKRRIVDVPYCFLASEAINTTLPTLRQAVQNSSSHYGTCLLRDCSGTILTDFNAVGVTVLNDLTFEFLAGSFFQNNPAILEKIMIFLQNWLKNHPEIHFLADIYCGTGVFGIALARSVQQFIGIEINKKSVALAQKNARSNGITNGKFLAGDATEIFKTISFSAENTVIIIDPPRKGTDKTFLQQILAFSPKAIAYISCAPDTQARDLYILLKHAPHYRLTNVQPFDMFPQTRHVECVAILERVMNK